MSLSVSINFNSLHIVNEELTHAIKQAATDFEAYLADPAEEDYLAHCIAHLAQIAGVFRLMQYPGAIELTREMEVLAKVIAEGDKLKENQVTALTHAFFVLPHYLEYISARQYEMPILMVAYINEMRASRGAELFAEHVFYPEVAEKLKQAELPLGEGAVQLEALSESVGRLRHMYQVGLLGVIKNQSSKMHFQLMFRAIHRAATMLGDEAHSGIWRLACAFIYCLEAGDFELTIHRKRYLAAIEKLMRDFANKGPESLAQGTYEDLQQALLFCLVLSGNASEQVSSILKLTDLPDDIGTDKLVKQQRELMHGPSLDTFESVIAVVKEELSSAGDILEICSQNNRIDDEDLAALKRILTRIGDTMTVLNLPEVKVMLDEQLSELDKYNPDEFYDFLATADTLLFVDSSLSRLKHHDLSSEALEQVSEVSRIEVMANGQLAEAERVVLEEAKSCISLAKRAITSYVESNFDSAHIANVSTTLNTVRGGLYILNFRRAASIMRSCCDFINDHMNQLNEGGHRHQLLETLADALISIEYYLNDIEVNCKPDEMILEIAEESLDALGFTVEKI